MQADEREVCLVFFGEVDAQSSGRLLDAVEQRYREGVRRFTLLLSTVGGSVVHGMSAYHFLRGLPIEVTTHNFGSVDSVGAVLYCAGKRRLAVPHARFVLHAPFFEFDEEVLSERQLGERLAKLQVDARNMAAVLADETGKTPEEALGALRARTVLGVQAAQDWGLVHETRRELVPEGAELVALPHSADSRAAQLVRLLRGATQEGEEGGLLLSASAEPGRTSGQTRG